MSKFFTGLVPEEDEEDDYIPPAVTETERLKRRLAEEVNTEEEQSPSEELPERNIETSWLPPPEKKPRFNSEVFIPGPPEATFEPEVEQHNGDSHPQPAAEDANNGGLLEGYSSESDASDASPPGTQTGGDDLDGESAEFGLSEKVKRQLGVRDDEGLKVKTLSSANLRNEDWFKSEQTWSATTVAAGPGGLHKRKHQITWLAGRSADDAKEIEERAARMRDAKRQTRLKYGW